MKYITMSEAKKKWKVLDFSLNNENGGESKL